uniref:Hypothetical secreted peptide n=1 Tax=Simulium vittatum TaxID=7192 RepID=B5M0P3_SIMVI|nr:hypothetical secreted peptide precursor [Simulium vittatum]
MKFATIVCAIILCIALFSTTVDAGPFFFGTIKRFVEPFIPKVNADNSGSSIQLPFGFGNASAAADGSGASADGDSSQTNNSSDYTYDYEN